MTGKYLWICKEVIHCTTFVILIAAWINIQTEAQSISVRGNVASPSGKVQNALVTFVDNSDTSYQVSALTDASGNYSLNLLTSVEEAASIPTGFELEQNYPNPFSASTSISYKINRPADVQIIIYDILGREIRRINAANQAAGVHGINWDAKNNYGQKMSAGVYFYQLLSGNQSITRKMLLGTNQQSNISIPAIVSSRQYQVADPGTGLINRGQYQIRVENITRTNPAIVPQKINNVLILRDTVINISVAKQILNETANVYMDSVRQIVRGFGASNVILWRPDITLSEVNTAYGTGDGQVGFSIFRIMAEADSNRWNLYLSSAKRAQEMGATIIAAPWFAPPSMVESVVEAGKTRSRVRYDMYNKYAAHLNAFIKYMTRNGVTIYGLSVQNEPDITDTWTSWSAGEMLTFMKSYANSITGTKVMAPESFQFRRVMSDPILNDSAASANTDIICGHLYGGGLEKYPLAEKKGKEIWMTEYLSGENNSGNDWAWCLPVAKQINDVLQLGMSAYVWWNIIRYYGPISDGTVDAVKGAGVKGAVTQKGFVMSQFTRFIRPGYHIIKSTSSRASVNITAAKGDLSKVVIVVTNTDTEPVTQTFNLLNSSAVSFSSYTTTSTKKCERGAETSVKNGSFSFILEPSSVTTFVSN